MYSLLFCKHSVHSAGKESASAGFRNTVAPPTYYSSQRKICDSIFQFAGPIIGVQK